MGAPPAVAAGEQPCFTRRLTRASLPVQEALSLSEGTSTTKKSILELRSQVLEQIRRQQGDTPHVNRTAVEDQKPQLSVK